MLFSPRTPAPRTPAASSARHLCDCVTVAGCDERVPTSSPSPNPPYSDGLVRAPMLQCLLVRKDGQYRMLVDGVCCLLAKPKTAISGTSFSIFASPDSSDRKKVAVFSGGFRRRDYTLRSHAGKGAAAGDLLLSVRLDLRTGLSVAPSSEPRKVRVDLPRTGSASLPTTLRNVLPHRGPSGGFTLEFGPGRVTTASVKNYQLAIFPPEVSPTLDGAATVSSPHRAGAGGERPLLVFQFGRRGDAEFALDFARPLSSVAAFALGLLAFDAL